MLFCLASPLKDSLRLIGPYCTRYRDKWIHQPCMYRCLQEKGMLLDPKKQLRMELKRTSAFNCHRLSSNAWLLFGSCILYILAWVVRQLVLSCDMSHIDVHELRAGFLHALYVYLKTILLTDHHRLFRDFTACESYSTSRGGWTWSTDL